MYIDVLYVHSVDTRWGLFGIVSTLDTISYLYLYVGLLPSRDPHTLVNGRQVLLYCINTPLFILFSFALLPRGYFYTYIYVACVLMVEGDLSLWTLFRNGWADRSISLGTLLNPLFFDILSVGVSVCIAPNFCFLFIKYKTPLTNFYCGCFVFWFAQFVTMATPLYTYFYCFFNTFNTGLLTGRLFFIPTFLRYPIKYYSSGNILMKVFNFWRILFLFVLFVLLNREKMLNKNKLVKKVLESTSRARGIFGLGL